jgi:hypothetical protein
LGLGLTKTPEVPNTVTVGNSVIFPMVHNTVPNSLRFMSYDCQKLNRSAESEIWADCTFRHKSGIWQNFAMTSLEILNTKISVHKLSFLLVTLTVYSDARFESYGIWKSRQGAKNFPDRLVIMMNGQVLRT